jgi:hypothetical protein
VNPFVIHYLLPELKRIVGDAGLRLLGICGDDRKVADWKNWRDGEPYRGKVAS